MERTDKIPGLTFKDLLLSFFIHVFVSAQTTAQEL